ncbi:MAG TPA: TOBE domain-containing protein, partial [Usitatibacter sp.]|nr:TOBE domain-containing protein [Usitatibacter sp.]
VSWYFTRFVIDDEELRIETGAVFKQSKKVPFARLQSVDIIQPFAARLFRLAELRLEAGAGGAIIAGTDGPVVLDARFATGMLGVRPEHIDLALERGVRAVVDNVEYLGGDSLVGCRVGGQPLAARVAGSVGVSRGDPVWLRWAPGAQHYFDSSGAHAAVEPREAPITLLA